MRLTADLHVKPLLILLLQFAGAVVILLFDAQTPRGIAAPCLYALVVLLSAFWKNPTSSFAVAGICSILTVAEYLLSTPRPDAAIALTNRGIALVCIWLTAALVSRRQIILRREREALEQVKVLQGLLPICAGCKKVRDDHGYWTHIEEYIRLHSEADFSHGLCPDCIKRLYPEFDEL